MNRTPYSDRTPPYSGSMGTVTVLRTPPPRRGGVREYGGPGPVEDGCRWERRNRGGVVLFVNV